MKDFLKLKKKESKKPTFPKLQNERFSFKKFEKFLLKSVNLKATYFPF